MKALTILKRDQKESKERQKRDQREAIPLFGMCFPPVWSLFCYILYRKSKEENNNPYLPKLRHMTAPAKISAMSK